jgi:hypothetical protein
MKNILHISAVVLSIFLFSSCYYDHPPEGLPFGCDEVSYSTHIVPILEAYCSTSGCHDGSVKPDLRENVSWNSLVSGGFVNLTVPEASILYEDVEFIGNPMPIGGAQLSELNRQLILCWISEGAKNN